MAIIINQLKLTTTPELVHKLNEEIKSKAILYRDKRFKKLWPQEYFTTAIVENDSLLISFERMKGSISNELIDLLYQTYDIQKINYFFSYESDEHIRKEILDQIPKVSCEKPKELQELQEVQELPKQPTPSNFGNFPPKITVPPQPAPTSSTSTPGNKPKVVYKFYKREDDLIIDN